MDRAAEHIEKLLSDPDAYRKAAAEEGRVWGHLFSDDTIKDIRARDAAAALRLRPRRDAVSFTALARRNGWTFDRGLSLACGSGRAERELIAAGVCRSFKGMDISAAAIEEARSMATERALDIEYVTGDLNTTPLGDSEYDLVVTQNCLHHIVRLEFLADEIHRCLRPGGRLWIDDFIGETQFQWLQERLDILNEIMSILPDRYKNFRLHRRVMTKFDRPVPGRLVSPFESIRSGEIFPIFSARFDVEISKQRDSITHLLVPAGARENYLETEEGPVIFELLMLMDRLLIEKGILPPLGGQFVMRKRDLTAARPGTKRDRDEDSSSHDRKDLEEIRRFLVANRAALRWNPEVRAVAESCGMSIVPSGFYYPIPTLADIGASFEYQEVEPFGNSDLFVPELLAQQLETLVPFAQEFNPARCGDRDRPQAYSLDLGPFAFSDAFAYYAMIRACRPRTILEIGSGASTLIAVEGVRRNCFGRVVCIEPFPPSYLKDRGDVELIEKPAQAFAPAFFNAMLADGDILFIDSTHTVKSGSDCVHLYLRILPYLSRSLTVHVHDIFLPKGLPRPG